MSAVQEIINDINDTLDAVEAQDAPQLSAKALAFQERLESLETQLAETEQEDASITTELDAINDAIDRLTTEEAAAKAELDALDKDHPRLLAYVALGRATEDEKNEADARMDVLDDRLSEIDMAVKWLQRETKRLEVQQRHSQQRIGDLQNNVRVTREDLAVRTLYDQGAKVFDIGERFGFSTARLQTALDRAYIDVRVW